MSHAERYDGQLTLGCTLIVFGLPTGEFASLLTMGNNDEPALAVRWKSEDALEGMVGRMCYVALPACKPIATKGYKPPHGKYPVQDVCALLGVRTTAMRSYELSPVPIAITLVHPDRSAVARDASQ